MTSASLKIPVHIAIIMDGNGRWAEQRGWPRIKGHQAGAESVREVLRCCRKYGVRYLTLYAFSVENWSRPTSEIRGLMHLLRRFLRRDEDELHKHRVRLRMIGRMQDLPEAVRRELVRVIKATESYTDWHLILALSYGGRAEITDAVRKIARRVAGGELKPADIDEGTVAQYLYVPDVPDPDLMIRTSGEMRLSNFLLWQLSYTELYITDVLWPDFRERDFVRALEAYSKRQRRFGSIQPR